LKQIFNINSTDPEILYLGFNHDLDMPLFVLLPLLGLFLQTEVPFKASDEFKVELEYKFKPRPVADNSFIDLTETVNERDKRISGGNPLPYLIVHMTFQKLAETEKRIRCFDNNKKNRFSRKVELEKVYTLDLGFTDDMKDRVTPYMFTFVLMSADKEDTSQIILLVEADGTFLINDVKRGKF
jgi:hypothetical protein